MDAIRRTLLYASPLLALVLSGCASAPSVANSTTTAPPTLSSTATTLTVSPNPATAGAAVTLTATVTGGSLTPYGTVTFYDGATALGAAVTPTAGVATLAVSTFAAGSTHTLKAVFNGDANHATSSSSTTTLALNPATPPSSIGVHATFSFASANQTISGFGAAEAFYTNYLTGHPYSAEIYKALFDPAAGLGLSYLRVQNNYRGVATGFDTDTPAIVAAANAANGTPLTVLMSSWSPSANLKSNGSVNGCTGTTNGSCSSGIGTLAQVNGAYNYAGFAQYWYDSLSAYTALGVTPAYVSIQNEPDFSATYAGCRFNPTEAVYNGQSYAGYGLAFDAVYKKLQTLAKPPAMVGPETFSVVNFIDMAAQIPAGEVSAYAHHGYNINSGSVSAGGVVTPGGSPDSGIAALQKMNTTYPAATKFETEYYDTPGFYNAWTIHNTLAYGNDNAYIFWQAAWPSTLSTDTNPAAKQGADQAGLIYLDNPYTPTSWAFSHGWTYNDAYYAMKHYSYFVRPGYIRYNATVDNTDERATVYQSPDKKTTVLVLLNVSSTATDGLSLDLSGIAYANSTVYRSTFSQPLTGERFANLGSYTAPTGSGTNTSGGINLPPQSVVTVVLTN